MPWPGALPDQVRAVAQVLASGAGARSWKSALPAILQTLEALGRARVETVGELTAWRSA